MSPDPSTEWAYRLQGRASDALDQLFAAMIDAQQLLSALPTVPPQELGDQLTRYWQGHLPDAYQQLADGSVRYLSRLTLVSATYGTEWLREVLPRPRLDRLGPPPPPPGVPAGADSLQWVGWYVLCGAWSAQQQAWVGRAFEALREEIATGAIGEEEIQASARRFLQDRLPAYLSDVAEVGLDLMSDGLAVADGSIHSLVTELLGHPPTAELTVEVSGPAGTVASTDLAIENNRDEPAEVRCTAQPTGGYELSVVPDRFHLVPGGSRRVSVRVALPELPTEEPVLAGRVEVTGHGDAPLAFRVRATALSPRRRITVRALGPAPSEGDASGDAPGDPD